MWNARETNDKHATYHCRHIKALSTEGIAINKVARFTQPREIRSNIVERIYPKERRS